MMVKIIGKKLTIMLCVSSVSKGGLVCAVPTMLYDSRQDKP